MPVRPPITAPPSFNKHANKRREIGSDASISFSSKAHKGCQQISIPPESSKKQELFAEYDTYACVLYKLKRKNEALTAANKAVEHAKKMGMDPSQYEETIELITKINQLN